jgi:TolB-like protein
LPRQHHPGGGAVLQLSSDVRPRRRSLVNAEVTAVLPFENIGDSTMDYFSAGIAEELISALGRLRVCASPA